MSLSSYPIRFLDWDSNLFGIKMGELELDPEIETGFQETRWLESLKKAQTEHYQFLQCRFDTKQHRLCNFFIANGAILGDVLLTFKSNPNNTLPTPAPEEPYQVRSATAGDLPQILNIAQNSFIHSRIFQDSHFAPAKAQCFYTKWIEDCMGKSETVLVLYEGSSVKGFVSVQLNQELKTGVIRLLAVDGVERGRGFGKILVNAVVRLALAENLTLLRVGTQVNNYPAVRLYEKNGFSLECSHYRMHIWLEDPIFKLKQLTNDLQKASFTKEGD